MAYVLRPASSTGENCVPHSLVSSFPSGSVYDIEPSARLTVAAKAGDLSVRVLSVRIVRTFVSVGCAMTDRLSRISGAGVAAGYFTTLTEAGVKNCSSVTVCGVMILAP